MIWLVNYTECRLKPADILDDSEPVEILKEWSGIFDGGNCREVIQTVCEVAGYPLRFDKEFYESGSCEYIYPVRDPVTNKLVHHCLKVAAINQLIKVR